MQDGLEVASDATARATEARPPGARRKPIHTVLGAVAAALAMVSLLVWLWPRSSGGMTCRGPLPGATVDHLARCDHGVKVRASSEDLQMGLHALWAIDGRVGGVLEKWCSREGDQQPWLQLEWPTAIPIARVVVHHGGERQGEGHSVRDFDVLVGDAKRWTPVARVRDNRDSVSVLTFQPVVTTALRLQILRGDQASSAAAIYEIEVHGP